MRENRKLRSTWRVMETVYTETTAPLLDPTDEGGGIKPPPLLYRLSV
ncbi:MAG: hypothetical protein WB791_02400 [Waddliaceae bacterium]